MPRERTCTECGKSQRDVFIIIAMSRTFICDECVSLCVEIIEERKGINRVKSFVANLRITESA